LPELPNLSINCLYSCAKPPALTHAPKKCAAARKHFERNFSSKPNITYDLKNIFLPKNSAKKMASWLKIKQNNAKFHHKIVKNRRKL
jgi:hypothetical protein